MKKIGITILTAMSLLYVGCAGPKQELKIMPEEKIEITEPEITKEPEKKQVLEEIIPVKTPFLRENLTDQKEYFQAGELFEDFKNAYEDGDFERASQLKQEFISKMGEVLETSEIQDIHTLYKNKETYSYFLNNDLNVTPEKNFNLNLTEEHQEYLNALDPAEMERIANVMKNIIDTRKNNDNERFVLYDFPSNPTNPKVQEYITLFLTDKKLAPWFKEALQRGQKYFPFVEQELEKRGLPQELKFKPLIESAYHEVIRSRASAQGMMQFMADTARRYPRDKPMVVNAVIDERMNPRKAVPGAFDYLVDLILHFEGDLELGISGYNIGEHGLGRRLQASGSLTLEEAIDSNALPRETDNYLAQIDATNIIWENLEQFGITDIEPPDESELYPPKNLDEVIVNEPTSLSVISSCAGIKMSEVQKLNPWLISWRTPKSYPELIVYLPEGTGERYYANIVNVNDKTPSTSRFYAGITIRNDQYVVVKNDTGMGIAKKLKVYWRHLQQANPGINWRKLIPSRTRLNIPEYSPYIKDE